MPAYSQIHGVITDKTTKHPIPFATISYYRNHQLRGTVADMQGIFTIPDKSIRKITVSNLGYRSQEINIDNTTAFPLIVELAEEIFNINEVIVTPENNPALRIIRRVIANKDRHNFEKYDNYSYQCYFKLVYDIQSPLTNNVPDTTKQGKIAILVSETVTECTKQGNNTSDKIIANKTSGFESAVFGQLTYSTFHKAVSFYNNSIQIFGETEWNDRMLADYVSPLSNNSIGAYYFQLEEEYVNENDTIFEISYYPKRRSFNGLMGTLFVSSNGYALSSIIAHPHEKSLIDFKFKQDFTFVGGKWFPANLEEEIKFSELRFDKKTNAFPVFLISSNINNISYDVRPNDDLHRIEKIFIDKKALEENSAKLHDYRHKELTAKEQKTHEVIDSAFAKIPFKMDDFVGGLAKFGESKYSFRKIDIDVSRIYSINRHEAARLGLGLYTNEKLIDFVSAGGYFGYGFKDKRWKYGVSAEFFINRKIDFRLKISHQNTLKEAGRNLEGSSYEFAQNYFRNSMSSRFDHCIENKLETSIHPFRSLRFKASVSLKNITPVYDYLYKNNELYRYASDDVQFSLRWAIGERFTTFADQRLSISRGNPILNLTYTRGTGLLRAESAAYNKIETSVDILAYNGRIGQSNLRIAGGYIDRDLPYGLLFTGEGSKDKIFSFLINHTFQTMFPYEFLSDKYLHAFYIHNFGPLLVKTKHFHPEFLIAYNAGWGNLEHPVNHGIDFNTKNHIYLEGGLMINNIVRFKCFSLFYIRLGAGAFYRHGYYHLNDIKDNFSLKIGLTFSFK
jgi:hypothetical protein